MMPRTHECIALGPAGNIQGSLKCFDIKTGKVVTRRSFTEFPMPDRVIKKVNHWGKTQKNLKYGRNVEFLNRSREQFSWENKELDEEVGLVEDEAVHPEIPAEIPGVELESDYEDTDGAVQDEPAPAFTDLQAAAAANADLARPTGVRPAQITGVRPAAAVLDLTDDLSPSKTHPPKVESPRDSDYESGDSDEESDTEDEPTPEVIVEDVTEEEEQPSNDPSSKADEPLGRRH